MDLKTATESVVMKKYATFNGRAARSEYWWFVLAYLIASLIVGVIDAVLGLGFLGVLLWLALLVPSVAVGVRRLHDFDKSGWWLLIALIPLVGALVLIYFFVQRGTQGDNRFGADPQAAEA